MGYRDDRPFRVGRVLLDAPSKWVNIQMSFYFVDFVDENHVNLAFCVIVYAKSVKRSQYKASKGHIKGVYAQIFILHTGSFSKT